METWRSFFLNSWGMLLELAPWLLLGLLIAALLKWLVPRPLLVRLLGGGGLGSAVRATLVGVPLPLCSCSVIPTGLGLHRHGASRQATLSFLISTPQTGVDATMVAAGLLGWPFALFKVVVAMVTGIIGGALGGRFGQRTAATTMVDDESAATRMTWRAAARFAIDDVLGSIWGWLLIGVVVSGLLLTWVPADIWPTPTSGLGVVLSLLVALVISLPMYICATASVPIAAGLVAAGMPTGAALVFLFAGPATNIATIGAVRQEFGWPTAFWYLAVIVLGSLLGGWCYEWWFGSLTSPVHAVHDHCHEHGLVAAAPWWQVASALLLGVLLLRCAWRACVARRRNTSCCASATSPSPSCCGSDAVSPAASEQ